jgi:exodeoxyribonuclease III
MVSNSEYSLSSILESIEKYKNKPISSEPIKSLLICAWNINSIRSSLKIKNFTGFITRFSPDIMCLLETKTVFIEHDRYRPHFDYPYQYWSSSNTHISGLCVLSKLEAVSITHGLNFHSKGRVLILEFISFILCVCYCPVSKTENDLNKRIQWDEELRNHVSMLKAKKVVVWIGDFNIVPQDIDADTRNVIGTEALLRHSFLSHLALGFVDSFRFANPTLAKYTWRSARTPGLSSKGTWRTRVDFILLDGRWTKYLTKSEIYDDYKSVSDHCPISISLLFT